MSPHLKTYDIENVKYKQYYLHKTSNDAAAIIVNKLIHHFSKFGSVTVRFRNRCYANASPHHINLGHNASIGTIVHEVAHVIDFRRNWPFETSQHIRHGTKQWYALQNRIFRFGDRMNWWSDEIHRRTARDGPMTKYVLGCGMA